MYYAWNFQGFILVLSEVNAILYHLWKYGIQYGSDCNVIRYGLRGLGSVTGRNVCFGTTKGRLLLRLTQFSK